MNTKNKHPLHREIGEHLANKLKKNDNIKILRDDACGGKQKISLFLTNDNTADSRLCQVDMMILKDNEIKIIIEIEESNIKPVQIFGKLFASTLAKYYIHETEDNVISMADDVCFIQVIDTKDLKKKSKKPEQLKNIEKAIKDKEVLKKLDFSIKTYKVFYGKLNDKELLENIFTFIKEKLKE